MKNGSQTEGKPMFFFSAAVLRVFSPPSRIIEYHSKNYILILSHYRRNIILKKLKLKRSKE